MLWCARDSFSSGGGSAYDTIVVDLGAAGLEWFQWRRRGQFHKPANWLFSLVKIQHDHSRMACQSWGRCTQLEVSLFHFSCKFHSRIEVIGFGKFKRLQLRIRCLPPDLNEVKFKDPISYGYFYEQTKNDFIDTIAPELTDLQHVGILLDLGCLEMR